MANNRTNTAGTLILSVLLFVLMGVVGVVVFRLYAVQSKPVHPAQPFTAVTPHDPTPSVAVKKTLPVVCLDPGHPSEVSSGNTLQNGLREVEVVYDVAESLRGLLERDHIAKVVMTRDFREYNARTKTMVTNRHRAEIANGAGARLLLRLHGDTGNSSGYTVYYPDKEGKAGGQHGPSATVRDGSKVAAKALHKGMAPVLQSHLADRGILGDSATLVGGQQGALTGSVFSEVPVVTVEMAFLNNKGDAAFLSTPSGIATIAEALEQGIIRVLAASSGGETQ
jgi:N-acetylmuramoyl-L-alanine amidase